MKLIGERLKMKNHKFTLLFIILGFLSLALINSCKNVADSNKKAEKKTEERYEKEVIVHWQIDPDLPDGWELLDRKTASIAGSEYDDFLLMTNGNSILVVWYQKEGKFWKMSLIATVTVEAMEDYCAELKYLYIDSDIKKNDELIWGVEGTEPIAYYKWIPEEDIFETIVVYQSIEDNTDLWEVKRYIEDWQKEAKSPKGWKEIHRIESNITTKDNPDIFIIMTDGQNDFIVWFQKQKKYWKMYILKNVISEEHRKYISNYKNLKLWIDDNKVYYGEGVERPVGYFEWDSYQNVFFHYRRVNN